MTRRGEHYNHPLVCQQAVLFIAASRRAPHVYVTILLVQGLKEWGAENWDVHIK